MSRDTEQLSTRTVKLLNKVQSKSACENADETVAMLAQLYLQNNHIDDSSASDAKEIAEARDEIREWIDGNGR